MRTFFITLSLFLLGFTLLIGQTQVTVYNHGQALVKESFSRSLPAGTSELEIEDVAEALVTASVKLSSDQGLQVLEQNYRYDLVDQNKLLKKYLGADVTVIMQNDKKMSGELLSYDNQVLVIKSKSGTDIIQRNFVGSIKCPTPSERLYVRPTLSWDVFRDKAGQVDLDLSYLTGGLSWRAEYVAVINENETELDLSSWINLNNQSGKAYQKTKLKLVAGDLHRAAQDRIFEDFDVMAMAKTRGKSVVEERQFFEYHLYDIAFPVTIGNREEKQIQWLSPTTVTAEKRYVYEGRSPEFQNIPIKIMFTNDKESGTGMPLPAGVVRLFKKDTDGSLEMVGEDNLDHTSKDDLVTLEVGNAFDVKAKYEVKDRRSKKDRYREEDVQITVANRKDEAVEVDIIQAVGYQNWEITSSSHSSEKLDARRVKFTVAVPKESELVLTYTARLSFK